MKLAEYTSTLYRMLQCVCRERERERLGTVYNKYKLLCSFVLLPASEFTVNSRRFKVKFAKMKYKWLRKQHELRLRAQPAISSLP